MYEEISDLDFACSGNTISQNRLTQIIPQEGKFTYHLDFDIKNWKCQNRKLLITPKNQINSSNTISSIFDASQDPSFFHLLKENMMTQQFTLISENLINSHENFYMPSARNVHFLRLYLRLYRKLSLDLFGRGLSGKSEFLKTSSNYLKFFRDFLENAFSYWKQSSIMELFYFPSEEQFSYDFFFNLCGHIFRLCLKHKQFNLDPSNAHIHCDIIFAFEYFEIIMKFLMKDFDYFMNSIGFYSSDNDHNIADTMPIIIRMIWRDKKPNYVSLEFKFFISHMIKSYSLGIYKMFSHLMKLFTRLAETIRICAGNVRPYNRIYSLRVSVADELFVALQKNSTKAAIELDYKTLQNFTNFTRQLPWLHQQFFVIILKRFINLNTQHFDKGKCKLSLKMILNIYLTGDVSAIKCDRTEPMSRKIMQNVLPSSKQNSSINYNTANVMPIFENFKEAELYTWSVASLIEAYLATNHFWLFVDIYKEYVLNMEYINEQITDDDICQQFDKHFSIIWGRSSTDGDLDALLDDFKMLHKINHFIQKFSQLRLVKYGDQCSTLLNFFEPVLQLVRFYKLSD